VIAGGARTASDGLRAVALAAALVAIYAASSPRGVALEDDGLFVLSAYFLGVEHPPGYPLFILLGHLFTYLPLGTLAWRVHLASAVAGAAAAALAYLSARTLGLPRVAAGACALALGLGRTFWSQAVIAEVYTLNALFLCALLLLALRIAPPGSDPPRAGRLLPAFALVLGLSLANHWPLTLLAAPGLVAILWPARRAGARLLATAAAVLALAAFIPYAWLVLRSQEPLAVSFYGPLESWREVWYFISRAGYAEVDVSASAGALDRLRYGVFLVTEFAAQLGYIGALPAAIGFAAQWRRFGTRVATGLTAIFLGTSLALALLLGFDYDARMAHVFHVYPIPAWCIAALWTGLGLAELGIRVPRLPVALAAVAVLLPIAALGLYANRSDLDKWVERYARTLLEALPRDAVVVVQGDADLNPLGYYHMVEAVRPDLTLVQPLGLVLGNRLRHPLRATREELDRALRAAIDAERRPVVATAFAQPRLRDRPQRDYWLHVEFVAPEEAGAGELPASYLRFLDEALLGRSERNAWAAQVQGELRRRYAFLHARYPEAQHAQGAAGERRRRALEDDFWGLLGLLEGTLARGRFSIGEAVALLERLAGQMPAGTPRRYRARWFELRAYLRQARGDPGARADFERSLALWPVRENTAFATLAEAYRAAGDAPALEALERRVPR